MRTKNNTIVLATLGAIKGELLIYKSFLKSKDVTMVFETDIQNIELSLGVKLLILNIRDNLYVWLILREGLSKYMIQLQ